MAPKYSIVMPTYNGEKYLVAQIESILLQTIPDFELIISDVHSSDNTFCVAKSYEVKDTRIKVFRNDTNLGFKKNIEKAIGLCGGDILLSDQDDLWMPNHIEVLASVMSPNVILACGKPQFVNEYNEELPRSEDYFSMDYIPTSNEGHARHIFLG